MYIAFTDLLYWLEKIIIYIDLTSLESVGHLSAIIKIFFFCAIKCINIEVQTFCKNFEVIQAHEFTV